jgi:hypothetical protein
MTGCKLMIGWSPGSTAGVAAMSSSSSSSSLSDACLVLPSLQIMLSRLDSDSNLEGWYNGCGFKVSEHSLRVVMSSGFSSRLKRSIIYRRTGRRYLCVEIIWSARNSMVGDEKAERYSGRDFILPWLFRILFIPERRTYLAKDLEAAFAITVFAKFCIAVIISSSTSFMGGNRRRSGFVGICWPHDGI